MVELIWNGRHKFFYKSTAPTKIKYAAFPDFYKNLRFVGDIFVHSVVCSSIYAPAHQPTSHYLTEEQNFQNDLSHKTAELTSNGK